MDSKSIPASIRALRLTDAIHDRLLQAAAIVDLLGCPKSKENPPQDKTPSNAAWAARTMIEEASKMASELFEITRDARAKIDAVVTEVRS